MFSQGRRMLAALQQGNISTSTPDVPVTKTLDKKSKEAPEKETQPDNSRETSVLGEKTNDESDSDDDSAFTPSEKNILNPAWPTVESPDDDYPSNLQENPSPCSILSSGRPSHNSSFGEDIHTSPMGLQNMLVSYGFTPEEENTTANYTSCAARKRLVFSSCNDREPNAEPAELMPLNDSTCHLSGQEKTFHELQTINLGETFPQESSVSLVQQQSTELKDMFYDDSEDVIIMSYDTPHDVQVEVRAVPEDTNAITEDQSVMEVEANVMTTPVQEEIAQRVKTPQKKRTRNAIPNNNSPSRKRIRNPKGTKIAKAKVAYNSGLAHTTSRGKERKARELKPGCPNTCRKKCQERISYERRCRLFKTYYSSASKEAQWLMLGKLVKKVPVSRRTVPGGSSPFRKSSYTYSLTDDDGNSISVCQSMFLATFDISITVVQNALRKNSPDKRGKQVHSRPTRVSPNLKEGVKNHIRSFPTIPSHYCREDSKRQYLQENLSVTKMYRMYLTERGKNTPNTASLRQYRDIFNYCFNLGFYQPKKDQCALCTKWKDLPEESKTEDSEIYQEYHEHVAAKEIARNLKQESKDFSRSKELNGDGKLKVICFDLQKVFFCPKSEIGDLFYKSKIACYNFTIYDCTLKKATCFVWDLTVAGRGAMEISSCVLKYIEQEVAKGVKEIHIYSDSCWGQNKNQFLFSMYYMACQKFQIKIVHRYLQKGHTQMECDSVHAAIEKKIKREDIFTPQEWYGYIKTAKVNKPLYDVVQVKQSDILSFSDLAKESFSWHKVPVSKVHQITFDFRSPGIISYKKKHMEEEETRCNILLRKPGRPIVWSNVKPPKAYNESLALKPNLLKDLKWMLDKNLIPDRAVAFYETITNPNFGAAIFPDGLEPEIERPELVEHDGAELDSLLNSNADVDDPDGL